MIAVQEALERILTHTHRLSVEEQCLGDCLYQALAEDIIAERDIPPVSNSAVDGYGLRAEDTLIVDSSDHIVALKVVDMVPAGAISQTVIEPGQAVQIMTGASIPQGVNAVVMVEDTERSADMVFVTKRLNQGENIRAAGEDVRQGEVILKEGTLLKPACIGMLAALGKSAVNVVRRANVGIVSTGDELIELGEPVTDGRIYDYNAYSLAALIRKYYGIPVSYGIARDDRQDLAAKISTALMQSDIVMISGGVSMGDRDYVKEVLVELGAHIHFWRVACKPGRPLVFATWNNRLIFGLPGNPVSVMVAFEEFVRPAMLKAMGYSSLQKIAIWAELKEDIHKKPGRTHFMRGKLKRQGERFFVSFTGEQGSGILSSMVRGNCLIHVPQHVSSLSKGNKVLVQILDVEEVPQEDDQSLQEENIKLMPGGT
ncbi:molybdenum cofactor synthesis domain protein [Candidatus Vecturithrix granuli]|uniref:Molybdopterin molybdenumtransferase n=1 Tax=Vecturithrix granuli TaxID=1499967 RepID=A0A081BWG1_VECG1|nr:molybdenum cofactor synthesis domain protein [Candidatus Vecturithrix granuli]